MLREREELTADEIREAVDMTPHSPNVWGALTNRLVKRGWMTPADKRPRPSRRPEAHGHPNPVYTSQLYRRSV